MGGVVRARRSGSKGALWLGAVVVMFAALVIVPGAAWSAGPTNVSGTVTSNTTWTLANSPYVMTGDVTVDTGVTLTIEPGVVVQGNSAFRQLTVNGSLSAVGTGGSRIKFTSTSGTAAGQWYRLNFTSGSGNSSLEFVDVEYGGGGGFSDTNAMVEVNGGTVTIEDSTVMHSSVSGLRVNGGSSGSAATVTVRRSKFAENGSTPSPRGDGLNLLNANVTIEDSAFWSNTGDGIDQSVGSSYAQAAAKISGSSIWGNKGYGVTMLADSAVAALQMDGNVSGEPGNAVYDNGTFGLTVSEPWIQLDAFRASLSVDWSGTYWGPVTYIPCPYGSTNGLLSYGAPDPNPDSAAPVPRGPITRTLNSSMLGDAWCGNDKILVNAPATMLPDLEFDAPPPKAAGITSEQTRGNCNCKNKNTANAFGPPELAPVIVTHRPVSTASGNLSETATDLKLAGPGTPFAWTRSYNSQDTSSGSLGVGWTHPFAASLVVVNAGTGELEYTAGSGQRTRFTRATGGSSGAATYLGKGFDGSLKRLSDNSYEMITRDRRSFLFNSSGQLTQIKPRFLPATTLAYTSSKLSSITDSAGRTITLSYNSGSPALIERVTLPDSRYVEYGYTSGKLTSVRDPRGKTWTLSYDATSGYLTDIDDPEGNFELQDVQYDGQGRVTSEEDGAGEALTYSYTTSGPYALTTVTPSGRGSTVYKHYGNMLVSITDPLNRVTSYTYDGQGRKATETDGRGNTWRYEYDSIGNVVREVAPSPAGFTIERTFNSTNDLLTEKDGRNNTTTYTYSTGADSATDYQVGQLKTVTDRESGVSTFKYWTTTSSPTPAATAVGLLKSSTDQRSKTTGFDYDSAGNLSKITSPLGLKTTMGYDSSGRLTSRRDPRGNVPVPASGYLTEWTYDDVDHVATSTDARGNVTSFDYYDNELLWKTTVTDRGSTARVTTLEYDADNRLWKTTDPRSGVETRLYWEDGLLKSVETGAGRETSYEYDTAGQLSELVEPNGNALGATASDYTWTYGYDDAGNRTTESHPDGGERETFYDVLNRPYQFDDALENRSSLTYDENDNVTSRTNGESETRDFAYDDLDRLLTETDGRAGTETTYEYFATGQRKSVTTPLGHKTSWALDDDGRVTSMVDARGNEGGATPADYTWTYQYDEAGNQTRVTDPLGNYTQSAYDAVNNVTQVTDQRGNATGYTYDVLNRLWKVTPPAAGAGGTLYTEYAYDANGNLNSRTDPNGHTTSWTHDLDGLMTVRTTGVGSWNYSHDKNGSVETIESPAGSSTGTGGDGTITYGYDRMSRQTSTDYSDATADVTRSYDLAGRPETMVDGSGTITYTVDDADRVTDIARTGGGSGLNGTFHYAYDAASNIVGRTLPDSTVSSYAFDDDGRLETITAASATTDLDYDAAGNLTTTTLPSGNGHVETRTYDRAGRLTTVENTKSPTILSKHLWTLDAAGNPTKVKTTRGASDVYDVYEYDTRNRLTNACYGLLSSATNCSGASNAITYAYDKVTNRTQEVRAGSVGNTGTIDYTYNAADQLTSTTKGGVTTTYTYDANGNQASAGARTYAYDLVGRLVSTTGSSITSTYSYDGDGRRVSTTVGGGADLRHIWDALAPSGIPELALERDASGNLVRRYVNGPTGAINYTNTSATFWYHHDPLNTVTDVTDASGTAQWRYEYEPYGVQRAATNVSGTAPENRLRFNGQHLDPETTLYHLRARQYDAISGRFAVLDPLEAPSAAPYNSAYAYVNGQPTVLVDPLGLIGNPLGGNPFAGVVDMGGFYGGKIKDAAVETAQQAADAYRGRGGGIDGVVAAVDATNPVADIARAARRTYNEAGGGTEGALAVLDWLTGASDTVSIARACLGHRDPTSCAAIALAAMATACGGPAAARLATRAGIAGMAKTRTPMSKVARLLADERGGSLPPVPGKPWSGPNAPYRAYHHLKDYHGLDPHVAKNRLHKLKDAGGLAPNDDVVIGKTGDVYDARTGEHLGSLTDRSLGS